MFYRERRKNSTDAVKMLREDDVRAAYSFPKGYKPTMRIIIYKVDLGINVTCDSEIDTKVEIEQTLVGKYSVDTS